LDNSPNNLPDIFDYDLSGVYSHVLRSYGLGPSHEGEKKRYILGVNDGLQRTHP